MKYKYCLIYEVWGEIINKIFTADDPELDRIIKWVLGKNSKHYKLIGKYKLEMCD